MNNNTKKAWFETWFDSKFYHILYQHRNEQEAARFISALVKNLNVKAQQVAVDLACGKGRHSVKLHQEGLKVIGLDLSENSIKEAQKQATEGLQFNVHDMRKLYQENIADYVFNLFTSFGYFDKEDDNLQTLKNIHQLLKSGGKLIIDYLNPDAIPTKDPIEERKEIDGITFSIKKHSDAQFLYKDIQFEVDGKIHYYQEKVQRISSKLFGEWLTQCGFEQEQVFGDYQLQPFDPVNSPRQIIISKKI